jgi:hypothetical protein
MYNAKQLWYDASLEGRYLGELHAKEDSCL